MTPQSQEAFSFKLLQKLSEIQSAESSPNVLSPSPSFAKHQEYCCQEPTDSMLHPNDMTPIAVRGQPSLYSSRHKQQNMEGVHPSFHKLFSKVYEIIDQIQDSREEDFIPSNRSLSGSKKDLSISKRVIDLSVRSAGKFSSAELKGSRKQLKINQKVINLQPQSGHSDLPANLTPSTEIKLTSSRYNPHYNGWKSQKSLSRGKGISLVGDSSRKQQHPPLITIMQRKVNSTVKSKPQGRERRNSWNPSNFFSMRRVSTKLF